MLDRGCADMDFVIDRAYSKCELTDMRFYTPVFGYSEVGKRDDRDLSLLSVHGMSVEGIWKTEMLFVDDLEELKYSGMVYVLEDDEFSEEDLEEFRKDVVGTMMTLPVVLFNGSVNEEDIEHVDVLFHVTDVREFVMDVYELKDDGCDSLNDFIEENDLFVTRFLRSFSDYMDKCGSLNLLRVYTDVNEYFDMDMKTLLHDERYDGLIIKISETELEEFTSRLLRFMPMYDGYGTESQLFAFVDLLLSTLQSTMSTIVFDQIED